MTTRRFMATRIRRVALLVAAGVTAPLALVTGTAHAITTPVAGAACGVDDLGRRMPEVTSYKIDPTVTHALAVNVANGSSTEQEYWLEVTDQVITEVFKEAIVKTDAINIVIFKITAEAKISVKNVNTHTELSRTRTLWRFTNPGYYGLYSGVQRVTGTVSTLHCTGVTQADGTTRLQWVSRAAGTFTTYGADESGSVRCEELYPAGSLRDAARTQLCGSANSMPNPAAAAAKFNAATKARGDQVRAAAAARAGATARATASGQVGVQAMPPTLTCDPGFYRYLTADRQLALGVNDTSATAVQLRAPDAGAVIEWQACHTTAAYPQYVLVARPSVGAASPRCLDMGTSGVVERATVQISPCTYRASQRFTLYRDRASGGVGFQSVGTGSMLAPLELEPFEGDLVGQLSVGREDGYGTFYQEQVQ